MALEEPTQHHQYDNGEPSNSSSPLQTGSSLSTSSSSPKTAQRTPPNTIIADHYAKLLNDEVEGLLGEICEGSDLVSKPDNSNILHIAASVGKVGMIDKIVERSPRLLYEIRNLEDDLPIHVAARACQLDAVNKLVFLAEKRGQLSMMLETKNEYHNTALHIALLNHQEEMAKLLFEKCPQTFYYLNKQNYSPLCLAIKAQFWEVAKDMLSKYLVGNYPDAERHLLKGDSVVHAAISAKNKDILQKMLEDNNELYKLTDEMKRRPLSYAAYMGFLEGVKYILEKFKNQAFTKEELHGYFPIHWACIGGNVKIVEEFFSLLPKETRFLLNNKGRNILHVAAKYGQAEVVKYILQQPELETLINMKDKGGNTPFHLASKKKHPKVVYAFTWDDRVKSTLQNKYGDTALDIAAKYDGDMPSFEERLTWLSLKSAGVPGAPQLKHKTKHNTNDNGRIRAAYKESMNTFLVVSILVATVTYASGFTVPGGYNDDAPNEGMATLAHKCAFQVFVISNTIAMYSSILAALTLIWTQLEDLKLMMLSLNFTLYLLGTALPMMSVAFMTGFYVALHDVVAWLSVVVLVIGGLFLGALLVLFIPLLAPAFHIKNKILRHAFQVPFKIMLLASGKDKSGKHR